MCCFRLGWIDLAEGRRGIFAPETHGEPTAPYLAPWPEMMRGIDCPWFLGRWLSSKRRCGSSPSSSTVGPGVVTETLLTRGWEILRSSRSCSRMFLCLGSSIIDHHSMFRLNIRMKGRRQHTTHLVSSNPHFPLPRLDSGSGWVWQLSSTARIHRLGWRPEIFARSGPGLVVISIMFIVYKITVGRSPTKVSSFTFVCRHQNRGLARPQHYLIHRIFRSLLCVLKLVGIDNVGMK